MSDRTGDHRSYAVTALAGCIFLFMALPWLEISCGGQAVAEQSGYQVLIGTSSPAEGATVGASERRRAAEEDHAAWWLALALLGAAAAGFHGWRATHDERAAFPAFWFSLAGAAVLSLSLAVGLPAEREIAEARTDLERSDGSFDEVGAAVGSVLQTERRAGLWLTLFATWCQVAVAGVIALERPRGASAGGRAKSSGAVRANPS